MEKYYIVRVYANDNFAEETIEENLTLEEAKEHCKDAESSSRTCKNAEGLLRTEECGPWFDAFRKEE